MNTLRLLHLPFNPTNSTKSTPKLIPTKAKSPLSSSSSQNVIVVDSKARKNIALQLSKKLSSHKSRTVILGAASIGVAALFLMGFDDHKAMALGPEGPLVEEFWDNMRRYALYALTVSTGALWALLEPIVELLKNPISAILILVIIAGSIFIASQVVTAMVGLSDFSYQYSY